MWGVFVGQPRHLFLGVFGIGQQEADDVGDVFIGEARVLLSQAPGVDDGLRGCRESEEQSAGEHSGRGVVTDLAEWAQSRRDPSGRREVESNSPRERGASQRLIQVGDSLEARSTVGQDLVHNTDYSNGC